MNTSQITEQDIEYWTNLYINYNGAFKYWCPQYIKDEIEKEEEEGENDCYKICLHPECE